MSKNLVQSENFKIEYDQTVGGLNYYSIEAKIERTDEWFILPVNFCDNDLMELANLIYRRARAEKPI